MRESTARLKVPDDPTLLPEWRGRVAVRLRQVLGLDNCEAAPLAPAVTEVRQRRGYRVERIVYSSEPFADVPGLLLIPDGVTPERPAPAVLCLHGNVPGAKEELAGEIQNPRAAEGLELYHDDYARELAQHGFVAFAIDLRDSGERVHAERYNGPPPMTRPDDLAGEEWRQIASLMAIPLGRTYLGMCVFDAIRALDYLETRPEVRRAVTGCVGFSAGATLGAWLAVVDRRVKVLGISGTSTSDRRSVASNAHLRRPAGLLPGFFVDLDADLCLAAIAPTPMVFARDGGRGSSGSADVAVIRRVYEGMRAEDDLKIDFGAKAGHVWHREVVLPWFEPRLRALGSRKT